MDHPHASALQLEWATLQRDHERHEANALWIKLAAVGLAALAALYALPLEEVAPLLLVTWVMEAMARTVQARLGERILKVETLIADDASPLAACQLHTEWLAGRPGAAGLLAEYARAALKPTVAFPHAFLLILQVCLAVQGSPQV
ncbi:MAG TPA: hypothetical protein VIO81_05980 [Methyloversatilis sp.]